MAKQSSNALSRLASQIMAGAEATRQDIMKLAASVLSQDETRGARQAKKRTTKTVKKAAKKRKATKRK